MMSAKHFRVHGLVQGVAFRANACERARELGLTGWVRNLPDGQVEVLAAGDDALLDTFERWLWQGPELARVTRVEANSASTQDLEGLTGFKVC